MSLRQVERPASRSIQKPVPSSERLAGTEMLRKEDTLARQAAPEPPADKGRNSRNIVMRQTATKAFHSFLRWFEIC